MKKVFKIFALAAVALCVTTFVGCKDEEKEEENNNNTATENPNNLPTSLSEDFANGVPSGWTNIDADGDGYAWQDWLNDQYGQRMQGDGVIMSASYLNGIEALTPDNYLVTPKLWIEDGAKLTYEVGAVDASYYQDHYAVLVGTVENGVFVSKGSLVDEDVPSPTTTTRTFDLSEYKGQELSIAFRHYNCTDMYIMTIDNVKIGKDAKGGTTSYAKFADNAMKVK
ncbi:MAG: choice-of-anchor J domain-containing protein [Bacteroidales bacterium]|nr:choice-of-anchor J domain-containing protein [Bacteroidales bacterium]